MLYGKTGVKKIQVAQLSDLGGLMKVLKNLTITAILTMLLLTGNALAERINSQILTRPNSPAEANCGSMVLAYVLEKKGMALETMKIT